MANEELVLAIKRIINLSKAGKADEHYEGYRDLFASPEFATYRPEDRRQALRLMILAKNAPHRPTPPRIEAHRSAIAPLTELVSLYGDPADHEMLGMCHELVGNTQSASAIYRAGLTIERERNPQSDLCGSLMKRVSLI
jgi:hypothetical protein